MTSVFYINNRQTFIDHLRSMVYNFGRVCLSVCLFASLSVSLSDDNFRKTVGSSYFTFRYLQRTSVKFIYEGHRVKVKVKVTGAKEVLNSYSRNVKLLSAITPIPSNICMQHEVFVYGADRMV